MLTQEKDKGNNRLKKTVYTIGTSSRTLKEFIALLEEFEIEVAADIRRFPTSKFEHFRKTNLEQALQKNKISYVYLGQELGGTVRGVILII